LRGVTIYMEGGGDGRDAKNALRRGMEGFLLELKDAARGRSWRWKLVCCGSRGRTFEAFRKALNDADDSIVPLLVDAEGPLDRSPREHLKARDGWKLQEVDDHLVHLMTQTMETWIIADPENLVGYYGQGFRRGALPKSSDLETVAKADIANALERATEKTRKGKYHKIRHAAKLLEQMDPERRGTDVHVADGYFPWLAR